MGTLHRYLTWQVLATLLMTVLVFTGVLLLGNVFKEIIALLVNRQASLAQVAEAVVLLIPFVLVFALPMGLLTATLLVFGRFSADQELTAVRAGGVSLLSLIMPILLLSILLSGVSALINMYVAPQCRMAYKRLLLSAGLSQAGLFLPEKTFIKDFPNHIVYIGRVDGSDLRDVLIYNLDPEGRVDSYIRAAGGRIEIVPERQEFNLHLMQAWRMGMREGQQTPFYAEESVFTYTNQPTAKRGEKVRISDMSFTDLRRQLRELNERFEAPLPRAGTTREALMRQAKELRAMHQDLTLPIQVQMHRQVSFSFACVAFTLVGIPLGIRAHRRETTFNIALALILVTLYYSFFIIGQSLDTRPQFHPQLLLWLPNFIFQAAGIVLLWRANKGF